VVHRQHPCLRSTDPLGNGVHWNGCGWGGSILLADAGTPGGSHLRADYHELNVIEQVVNVSQTTVVRDAWARGQSLAVHGWIYDLRNGLLCDLDMCITAETELPGSYAKACGG